MQRRRWPANGQWAVDKIYAKRRPPTPFHLHVPTSDYVINHFVMFPKPFPFFDAVCTCTRWGGVGGVDCVRKSSEPRVPKVSRDRFVRGCKMDDVLKFS